MARTYQFIISIEDDPVTPFTAAEIEEIKAHLTNSANNGIELPSSGQFMYLADAFDIKVNIIVKE